MPPKGVNKKKNERKGSNSRKKRVPPEALDNPQVFPDPAVPGPSRDIRYSNPTPNVQSSRHELGHEFSEPDATVSPQFHGSERTANLHVTDPEPTVDLRESTSVSNAEIHESIANPQEFRLISDSEVSEHIANPRESASSPEVLEPDSNGESQVVPELYSNAPELHSNVEDDDARVPEFVTGGSYLVYGSIAESIAYINSLGSPHDSSLFERLGVHVFGVNWFPALRPPNRWHCRTKSLLEQYNIIGNRLNLAVPDGPARLDSVFTSIVDCIKYLSSRLLSDPAMINIGYPEILERQMESYAVFSLPNIPEPHMGGENAPTDVRVEPRDSVEHPFILYTYPRGDRIRVSVRSTTLRNSEFLYLNREMCTLFEFVEYATHRLQLETIDRVFKPLLDSFRVSVDEMMNRGESRAELADSYLSDLGNLALDCIHILETNKYILSYVHSFTDWIRSIYENYIFTSRHIGTEVAYEATFRKFDDYLRRSVRNLCCYPHFVAAFVLIKEKLLILLQTRYSSRIL